MASFAKNIKLCQVLPKIGSSVKFCQKYRIVSRFCQIYEVMPSFAKIMENMLSFAKKWSYVKFCQKYGGV
jgi:hypothetical protein